VLTVPAHKLLAGMLELPRVASGVPMQQIARMELARTHRRDPHSFELAYWNLPTRVRPSEASHVYAAACPHDDANSYLDLFESQGLDVVALDVQSTALTRACSALISNAANVTAILDVGWLSARLALVHDGVIVFERTFEEGGVEPVHRVLGHRFSLQPQVIEQLLRRDAPAGQSQDSPLEELLSESRSILAAQFDAIVQELQVSFSYIAHQFPDAAVDQVLLVGGGAMMPGMCDYLNNTLNVKTRPARACDLAACDPAYAELGNSGALTTAVGLAQWRA
jgi:Tfp pilus assembly PilM family ATPase